MGLCLGGFRFRRALHLCSRSGLVSRSGPGRAAGRAGNRDGTQSGRRSGSQRLGTAQGSQAVQDIQSASSGVAFLPSGVLRTGKSCGTTAQGGPALRISSADLASLPEHGKKEYGALSEARADHQGLVLCAAPPAGRTLGRRKARHPSHAFRSAVGRKPLRS